MKTQICIVSLIRTKLSNSIINKMKVFTSLTICNSLRYTIMKLQINIISLKTMKTNIIATVSFSKKMIEQITSLMRIRLFLKSMKSLSQKLMRMLTSIML